MATAGIENLSKRPFQPALMWPKNNEEPENVSEGRTSARISAANLISELELMLKQKTFTRSETQRLLAVLRTIEESPSSLLRLEASSTSGPLKKRKSGDESDNKATCLSKTTIASPQHPTTIENLPDELLANIFIRLLAKQLSQMRSVSKSWNAFLSRSSFIKSHLNRSIHNNDQIFLHFPCDESSSGFEPFTAPSRSPLFQLTNSIKLPVNPQSEYKGIRVIGSVNGLICSSYDNSVIHIWNPSLSAMVTLPPYSMPSGDFDPIRIFFRFGYDPKTDDYKVVKLTGLYREYICDIEWWLQVEVYSMRKGTWELITDTFPSHIRFILDVDHICVDGHNGHLHWLGCIGEKNDIKTIVAFDLGSQTFREIPLPPFTFDGDEFLEDLVVFSGKLCVMSWVGDGTCEVWVMEEYGVVESWVKHHVFSQFSGNTYTFGLTLHNEFFYEDVYGRLVFYDTIADKAKIVENYRLKDDEKYEGKFVEYVDSLVWVAPAKREMVDGVGQNRN